MYSSRLLEIAWKPATQIETGYFSPLLRFHVHHTSDSPSKAETPGEWTHSSSDPLRAAEQGRALLLTLSSAFSGNAVVESGLHRDAHTPVRLPSVRPIGLKWCIVDKQERKERLLLKGDCKRDEESSDREKGWKEDLAMWKLNPVTLLDGIHLFKPNEHVLAYRPIKLKDTDLYLCLKQ